MSISRKITGDASGGSGGSGKYVDDVFSTYLYTGTGADRDIVNGIDLDDKGGLVWTKCRNENRDHLLFDTDRGPLLRLRSHTSEPEYSYANTLTAFNSDGFSIGSESAINHSGSDFASWTFAKQEGFFDIVTYTGNGVAGRQIPHNLGSTPGMVIIKSLNQSSSWVVYHKDLGPNLMLSLDSSAAAENTNAFNSTAPTDTAFVVGSNGLVNQNPEANGPKEYVAYLFAHDAPLFGRTEDESIIKCGSYTGTGVTQEIDLGWEPQFLLLKDITAGTSRSWFLVDCMRGITDDKSRPLYPDFSGAEGDMASMVSLTASGFLARDAGIYSNNSGKTYIYMAIRRPHKPAEEFEPEELFATVEGTSPAEPGFVSGFPVDMAWYKAVSINAGNNLSARLLQTRYLAPDTNSGQSTLSTNMFDYMDGYKSADANAGIHAWMFRRAPGFFDVVTYAGNSVVGREVPHNLRAVPEMMWVKSMDGDRSWNVYSKTIGNENRLLLNGDHPINVNGRWNDTDPTDSVFTVDNDADVNSSYNYIAYLWASVPGICDIGTYTGNGDWQHIDCGFGASTPRFVLIKSTSETGDWYYWDSLRGFDLSDNPYLMLNSTGAQVTNTKWIQPSSGGITGGFYITSSSGSGIYKDGVEYIYMAIA